jgi:hypothetical protein
MAGDSADKGPKRRKRERGGTLRRSLGQMAFRDGFAVLGH